MLLDPKRVQCSTIDTLKFSPTILISKKLIIKKKDAVSLVKLSSLLAI